MSMMTRLFLTAVGVGLIALDAVIPGTAVPGGAIILGAWIVGKKS
jgi:hypothetical protein